MNAEEIFINLYHMENSYKDFIDSIVELEDDECNDSLEEAIKNTADCLKEDVSNSILALGAYIKNTNLIIDAIKTYLNDMNTRKLMLEAKIERAKKYILGAMKIIDEKKICNLEVTVNRRKTPPKVIIDNEFFIPSSYFEARPPVLNKIKMKEDLKAHKNIKGAHLEVSETVNIK